MHGLDEIERRRRPARRLILAVLVVALLCGAAAGYTMRGWGQRTAASTPVTVQAPATLDVDCDRPGSDGLFDCQVTDYNSAQAKAVAHCTAPSLDGSVVTQTFSCDFSALGVAVSADSQCLPLEMRAWSFGLTVGSGECDVPLRRTILEAVKI